MKRRRFLLLATAALAGVPSTAHADPFSIGNLILTAIAAIPGGAGVALGIFGAVGTTGLGSIALGLAVAGLNLASSYLSRPNIPLPDPIKNVTKGDSGPGRHAFGRVILGGKIDYGRTADNILHRLVLMCFGVVDEIEEWYVNGSYVQVETDGHVSSAPWGVSGGSYLHIWFKAGTGAETAWPLLMTTYPDEWTSEHRVRGVAQYLAQASNPGVTDPKFGELFQKGFPEITAKAKVGHFYDPRSVSSAWSMNGALIALHYFRLISGYTDAQIDFDKMGDAADWCDVVVDTATGTAPRSHLSGGWDGVLDVDKVVNMLECAGLQMRTGENDKVYFEGIADDPVAELTFPWQYVLEWELQDGPEGVQRANVCRVKYFAPEARYTVEEVPGVPDLPWATIAEEIAAVGERERTVDLTFCPKSGQAQRIARRMFWMERAPVLVIKTSLAGIALDRLYCVNVEIDGLGTDGGIGTLKCILDDLVIDNGSGTCEASLRVIPDILKTAFNPTVDEADPPPVVESPTYDVDVAAPDAPSGVTVVRYPVSGTYETRVQFSGQVGGADAEAVYQVWDAGEPMPLETLADAIIINGETDADALWLAYEDDLNLLGETVWARARLFNADGDASGFSAATIVDPMATDNTAPAAPTITGCTYTESGWSVSFTAPTDISVVAIRSDVRIDSGAWAEGDIYDVQCGASGTDVAFAAAVSSTPYDTSIRFVCLATDGTESTPTSTYTESVV